MYVEITEGNSTVASVEIRALPGVPDSGLTTYAYAMRSATVNPPKVVQRGTVDIAASTAPADVAIAVFKDMR